MSRWYPYMTCLHITTKPTKANLDPNGGNRQFSTLNHGELQFSRPVLVIQADSFNSSRIGTVVVAAVTANLHLAQAPGNVRLTRRQSSLTRESVVNVSQVITLDRGFLREKVGQLTQAQMNKVDAGLRLALAL